MARDKLAEIAAVTDLPIWVSEVGSSTFGAEEVQQFGLRRTAELLIGRSERIHWYSLYDLPKTWPATTRHREAEGSAYYRHFYMGLLREDGAPKLALGDFHTTHPRLASANGSISTTIVSTMRCDGCANSALLISGRGLAGPRVCSRARSNGSMA